MDEYVFMSPKNGALATGIPLYPRSTYKEGSYTLSVADNEALAYLMNIGSEEMTAVSAEWVHENLECFGEL
jgi:hypothetical protein